VKEGKLLGSYFDSLSSLLLDGAQESSIGIANRRRNGKPRNRGSFPGRVKRISSSPSRL
jgi:hypothetical protein